MQYTTSDQLGDRGRVREKGVMWWHAIARDIESEVKNLHGLTDSLSVST
jgi:hypothetical protein